MAKQEHLEILEQGVSAWNKWRLHTPYTIPDLSGAKLRYRHLAEANFGDTDQFGFFPVICNLSRADLSESDLTSANFGKANLSYANLWGARLNEANLVGADLTRANFSYAKFDNTNLSHANLGGANFFEADLFEVNLFRATVSGTKFKGAHSSVNLFVDIDLREANGLEAMKHFGPSEISLSTIYRSEGRIPEVFLRGCGVSEDFITYMRSLVGKTLEFYSCFISYSGKDGKFAERLHADLQARGVRCWFAPEDLKIGEKIRVGIDESIRVYDKLLLILSKNSIESEWVEKEVETAMERERLQKRIILFPIRLDDRINDVQSGWAADIRRSRNIGDFRRWKNHGTYSKAFERLLHDLKAEA